MSYPVLPGNFPPQIKVFGKKFAVGSYLKYNVSPVHHRWMVNPADKRQVVVEVGCRKWVNSFRQSVRSNDPGGGRKERAFGMLTEIVVLPLQALRVTYVICIHTGDQFGG